MDELELATRRLIAALRNLEGFDPDLDMPLIDEVARSAVNLKLGERFLLDPRCSAGTYAAVSDAMAKHASRLRNAMKELAVSRAARLRFQSVTSLVAEIKNVVDRVIREE